MDAGLVGEVRNDCRIHVGESPRGMFSKHMATASGAPFAKTQRRLAVRADVLVLHCVVKRSCRGKPFWCSWSISLKMCGRLTYSAISLPEVFVRVAGVAPQP